MAFIASPPVPDDDPDRFMLCTAAISEMFATMIAGAIAAGWTADEVSAAALELSRQQMMTLIAARDAIGVL